MGCFKEFNVNFQRPVTCLLVRIALVDPQEKKYIYVCEVITFFPENKTHLFFLFTENF